MSTVGLDPSLIDDVILGNANGAGEENRNVARMAALLAGFPVEVGGPDRQPAVRLRAAGHQLAAHAIMVGDGDVFVAGGVESMTRAPLRDAQARGRPSSAATTQLVDTTLGWRFVNPRLAERHHPDSMGETGENVAEQCGVSPARTRTRSRCSASSAPPTPWQTGRFDDQMVPVPVPQRQGRHARRRAR